MPSNTPNTPTHGPREPSVGHGQGCAHAREAIYSSPVYKYRLRHWSMSAAREHTCTSGSEGGNCASLNVCYASEVQTVLDAVT